MAYSARIEGDYLAACGKRLTVAVLTYPRFVHSELLTHRVLSKSSASSRAIPVEKMLAQVESDPVMPVWWGKQQSGMQAKSELPERQKEIAVAAWLDGRDRAVETARNLHILGVHKQLVNRVVEPWMWITAIVSGTEWENFFNLRCHKDAQPEIQKIAYMMRDCYNDSKPLPLQEGEWATPFIQPDEQRLPETTKKQVSVARIARVSFLQHDGSRDISKDIALYERLYNGSDGIGHMAPFEPVAKALVLPEHHGNFVGFRQFRQDVEAEKKSSANV